MPAAGLDIVPGDQQSLAVTAAIVLDAADFHQGSLQVTSYARPGKLFTASGDLLERVRSNVRGGDYAECWLTLRTLPSGSLNQATRAPSGAVQMPASFWGRKL